ncbi:MAG: hypothetical protein OXP28_07885 [Gammaproteobacteria bacterium]|nr:hypothetical protein [Gammaproteobacteria bacterium]
MRIRTRHINMRLQLNRNPTAMMERREIRATPRIPPVHFAVAFTRLGRRLKYFDWRDRH